MNKKLREVAGTFKKQSPPMLTDETNNIILNEAEKHGIWKNYIKDFLGDNRLEIDMATMSEGPEIIESEVMHALEVSENGKAIGLDSIPMELLKLINEENIDLIVKLANR
ncbi:hypothetical protein HHI36_007931 [Cryptolaemus montrouzieri]|uniref:Uncharacterized protein n=1 Tax=Cryptolaemus montrouzieri TaxID=559131 RepID=A0ABD2MR10_9CUCU